MAEGSEAVVPGYICWMPSCIGRIIPNADARSVKITSASRQVSAELIWKMSNRVATVRGAREPWKADPLGVNIDV